MERQGSLLLVEDEDSLRGLIAQFLRRAGFRVVEARDGAEGVQCYRDRSPFDLALVDLNLPVFSGVEVCRQVRRLNPEQRIMICSAAIMADHERALLDLGIDHFLTKPYHPEVLLAHIALEVGRPVASAILPLATSAPGL
jgi:DNA-binding response OmpR family regulator